MRYIVRVNRVVATLEEGREGRDYQYGAGCNASVTPIAELIGGSGEPIASRLEPHDTLADTSRTKELLVWEVGVLLGNGTAELKMESAINK